MNNAVSTIHFMSLDCQGLGDKRKKIQYLNEHTNSLSSGDSFHWECKPICTVWVYRLRSLSLFWWIKQ